MVCPCFDSTDLDAFFSASDDLYAQSWAVRNPTLYGTVDEYGIYGTPASGTVGPLAGYPTNVWYLTYTVADIYKVSAEADQAYCSMWSESWVGSGYGEWAGDYTGSEEAISAEEYDVCPGHLEDWTSSNALTLTSY